jgi:hypothetical protein
MATTVETPRATSTIPELDLYRIGGISGIAAGSLAVIANALHPRMAPSDLGNTEKLLEMVSGYSLWRIDHLAIVFVVALALIAAVGLTRSITDLPAASWARVALASTVVTSAVAAVSFSMDGFVLAEVAQDWAQASGAEQAAILERARTVQYFDGALFAVTIIGAFGVTQLLTGLALWQSSLYPKWIGATALFSGVVGLVSGSWMWMSGEIGVGNFLVLFTITSVLFAVWLLAASFRLLRRSQGAPDLTTLQT